MAYSSRRPAPIATEFSRDNRVVGATARTARWERFDDRTVQIVTLIAAIALLGLVDAITLDQAMWHAVRDEITPILRRLQWAWSSYWRRDA